MGSSCNHVFLGSFSLSCVDMALEIIAIEGSELSQNLKLVEVCRITSSHKKEHT